MNASSIKKAMDSISVLMEKNKQYLVDLDAQNGDGDLGISMSGGYSAVAKELATSQEADLGKLMMKASGIFNEAAPSSLGTITSFGLMGMAKALKGKEEASLFELTQAMQAGVALIMEKAKSKPGEKTILDALCPALEALASEANAGESAKQAFAAAAKAAAEGSENTKNMRSVHGRAAYYGDKSIGILDGGSVVGKLIFEGIENSIG